LIIIEHYILLYEDATMMIGSDQNWIEIFSIN
jgi:hypothetical protein